MCHLVGRGVEQRFSKSKRHAQFTLTMISPVKGLSLALYLTFTNKSIGTLLVQGVEGVEHPIKYLSRSLSGKEMNYSPVDQHYLTLYSLHKNFATIWWLTTSTLSQNPSRFSTYYLNPPCQDE